MFGTRGVGNLHASWAGDGTVDTELQRSVWTLAPEEGKGPKRVEVGDATIGVMRRSC